MDRQLQERLSKKFADMKIDERINLLLMHYADDKNNSRMTVEQTQLIDHLFDGYYPLLFGDELNSTQEYDYRNQVLDIMIEEGIISGYADFGKTATLTAFGHRTNERGGWLAHVARQDADREVASTLVQSNINTNRFIRLTLYAVIASAIFQVVSIVVTHCDEVKNREQSGIVQKETKAETEIVCKEKGRGYLNNGSLSQTSDTTTKQTVSTKK